MYIYKVIFNSNMLSLINSEIFEKPFRLFHELISFLNNIIIFYHIYEIIISLKSHKFIL